MASRTTKEYNIAFSNKITIHELTGFSTDISVSKCAKEISSFFKDIKNQNPSLDIQYHSMMQSIDLLVSELDICQMQMNSLLKDVESLKNEQQNCSEMSTSLQKEISEVRNQITENAEKVKYDNLLESKAQEIQDKYDTVTDLELKKNKYERLINDYKSRITKVKQEMQEKYDTITKIMELLSK